MGDTATNQAVGSHEAAAIMGVHHTQVAKMAARGWISAQILPPAHVEQAARSYAVYSGEDCERNYREYEDSLAAGHTGRPRQWLHLRPDALRHLRGVKTRIAFEDAIGPAEASEVLKVHPSFLARLASSGRIVGRRPWSPTAPSGLAANWIYSRKSCLENVKAVRQAQSAGGKVGRPRNLS